MHAKRYKKYTAAMKSVCLLIHYLTWYFRIFTMCAMLFKTQHVLFGIFAGPVRKCIYPLDFQDLH